MTTQQDVSFFQNILILRANGSFYESYWSYFDPELMTKMHLANTIRAVNSVVGLLNRQKTWWASN